MNRFVASLSAVVCAAVCTLQAAESSTPATPSATPVAPVQAASNTGTVDAVEPPYANYPVSALQFGVWYGVPSSTDYTQVYGFKSGWVFCGGHGLVCGLEAAWLGSMTDYIQGLQTAPIVCVNRELSGLQASLICNVSDRPNGVQASVINVAGDLDGVQFGLVNYATNGVQVGLINIMEGGILSFFPIFNLKI